MSQEIALEGNVTYGAPLYTLEAKTREAIDSMKWLTEADEGIIALALQYAKRIDNSLRVADDNPTDVVAQTGATKALYLGPHLVNALKTLGGSPGDRMDLEAKRKAVTAGETTKEEDPIVSFLNDNLSKVSSRVRARQ